jgi:ornithine cyclodeaminase/alanine dehydrogenase-like protein (mu-crystallin family)
MEDSIAAIRSVFTEYGQGEAAERNKSAIHIPTDDDNTWYRYVTMEGGSRGLRRVAIRIKTDMVTWSDMYGPIRELWYTTQPGKYGGLILLFSAETGELLALLNDGFIQHQRVGATYGIGDAATARPDSRVVGLLGSGGMAEVYAQSISMALPIRTIKVFSPNADHRESFARRMSEKLNLDVVPAASANEAAHGADILASQTDAIDPLIFPEMIQPGMHVNSVTTHEMHPDSYKRFHRMVVQRTNISEHHYTTPENWRPRQIGGSHTRTAEWESVIPVQVTLSDVLVGRAKGRERDDEITYFTAEGMGLQFVALANIVYDRAKAAGLGQELPLEWFLQDIRN